MKTTFFFNDNPFAPPPDNLDYIGDLNTGRSYIETYKALIRDPSKEILLPIVFYADAAVTGQFVALSVTAVQFSLGIFSRVASDKEHMWRTLGYIPSYCKVASRGKGYFKQTGHTDAPMAYQNTYLENEGDVLEDNTKVSACPGFACNVRRYFGEEFPSGAGPWFLLGPTLQGNQVKETEWLPWDMCF